MVEMAVGGEFEGSLSELEVFLCMGCSGVLGDCDSGGRGCESGFEAAGVIPPFSSLLSWEDGCIAWLVHDVRYVGFVCMIRVES